MRERLLRCRLRTLMLLAAGLLPGHGSAPAQSPPPPPLPEAPTAAASLTGEVADPSGALVPGARVLLRLPGQREDRETTSDPEGHFAFSGLRPGEYSYLVEAPGFESFKSVPFALLAGEARRLPTATLALPANHADAYVTLNRREIATLELHAAEQQRILLFPDFYTSFVWDAAPLDRKQKFSLALHSATDPMSFVTPAAVAGAEQLNNTFPGFGPGPAGYAKRYGAAYGDALIGRMLGSAVFPAVFRQDPRYFYMGSRRPLRERVRHALLSSLITRGDNGHPQPNYSHILGNAAAGALSTVYHPNESAANLALRNGLIGIAGEAGVNLVRELVLKRFVHGGDVDANGMP